MTLTKPYEKYIGKWFRAFGSSAHGIIYEIDPARHFQIRFIDLNSGGDTINGWAEQSSIEEYKPKSDDYHKVIVLVFKLDSIN